jgi:RNA polymerase sigma-70 factor (ECF subfamily)
LLDPNVREIEETVSSVATSLLARALGNDQDAWSLLVELHAPLVYGWCRLRGLSADEALDIGQEVFVAVTRNLNRYDRHRDGSTFRGWLRTITENKIRDHWRRQNRLPVCHGDVDLLADAAAVPSFDATAADTKSIFVQLLEMARERINPVHWQIFWETTVDERSPVDVAAKYGIERHNLYMIKSRVLRLLRELANDAAGGSKQRT